MEITAHMVKDLRESTGAGMMDCKKALSEAAGDMDKAVDILRTKGLADLAKRAGRATNEGVIASYVSGDARTGALVEVNCETDFVARNADFKSFAAGIAEHVAGSAPEDVAALMRQPFSGDPAVTVEQHLGERVTKIGEKMTIPRFARFTLGSQHGVVSAYIHGVGNIGVLVECSAGGAEAAAVDAFAVFAKDVAMQIAAAAPLGVRREDVPAETIEHEMAIYKAQAAKSGKPEQIQDKIAQGRLAKFFKEVCLVEQAFVKDPDITIEQLTNRVSTEVGAPVAIVRFARFLLGETSESGPGAAC